MIADEIRVQGHDQHWNVTIFFTGQDKNVYKYNVGEQHEDIFILFYINIYLLGIKKNDKSGVVDAAVTNRVTSKSHSDHVRALTLNPMDQRNFVTVSDDGWI